MDPGDSSGNGNNLPEFTDTLRFASYNVSLFGKQAGAIKTKLASAESHVQFRKLAGVIKSVRPDVLVLMEIDYDETGETLELLNTNLLNKDLDGYDAIDYPYAYQIESNTGVLAPVDIDGNGNVSLPNDAFGFGVFEGQYASAILSKFPIDVENQRTFKNFLWKDMPDAALPENADGSSYYTEEALSVFRLSSKNHIDLPIKIAEGVEIHALISHPTPPVFDGVEDRNGRRNHDEIRLWADYLSSASYISDDNGVNGGLSDESKFILFGDLNADPLDGDSYNQAINALLTHSKVNQEVTVGNLIPSSIGGAEHNQSSGDVGDPSNDTSFFGLRIDYVIPSANLEAIDSGVFWPATTEPGNELIKDKGASDHLLVWIDVVF